MPKKKQDDSQTSQPARFRSEVQRLIAAGELNPADADKALDRLVRRAATMNIEDVHVVIEHLPEEDGGGYLATVPEPPGCTSDGKTRAEALANVEDAIRVWVYAAKKMGRAVPQPSPACA